MIAAEEAERDTGEPPLPKPSWEEVASIPKYTTESAGYLVECWDYRKKGKKHKYIGETS